MINNAWTDLNMWLGRPNDGPEERREARMSKLRTRVTAILAREGRIADLETAQKEGTAVAGTTGCGALRRHALPLG
jgi:hypothetical protein